MQQTRKTKLRFGTLLSYGIGAVGEGIGYNVFFSFFSFFLTTQAGIKPGIAGVISALAVLWDAITDPIIGNWSDRTKNKRGRRRPFIMSGSILFGISIALLFVNLNLPYGMKVAYYILVNMFYWFSLTTCVIPHISLGSELSEDFDERTKLRTFAVALMGIGTLIAVGTPLLLVEFFTNLTGSANAAWALSGVIYGALTVIVYELSCFLLRGKEPQNPNLTEEGAEKSSSSTMSTFFKNSVHAFQNKSLRKLIWITFFVNVTVTLASGLAIYLLTFVYRFDENQSSLVYAMQGILVIVASVLVGFLANQFDKKIVMIGGVAVYAVSYIFIILLPISWATIIVHVILFAIGNAGYWTMIYAMSYDASMIEHLKSGDRPDGLYTSLIGLFMKFGNAAGSLVTGLGLQMIGFIESSETQSAATVTGIRWLYAIVPAVFLAVAVIYSVAYPLTRKRFAQLSAANDEKEETGSYDPSVLEGL